MRSNIPKTSKLYGLNYLILCPHIKKSVLVKDIISIIFVGNAFLFEKSFLSHHRGFINVFGIEQQLTWVTGKQNKKSLKLVDIADLPPCLLVSDFCICIYMYMYMYTYFYIYLSVISSAFHICIYVHMYICVYKYTYDLDMYT
jgi:hypothetical protein